MQTVIFGRPGCPYCVRAKDLAEKFVRKGSLKKIYNKRQVNP